MPERTTLQIRNISTETVERMRQAAGARGWTYARYVEALVELHELMLVDDLDENCASRVRLAGLQPVRA